MAASRRIISANRERMRTSPPTLAISKISLASIKFLDEILPVGARHAVCLASGIAQRKGFVLTERSVGESPFERAHFNRFNAVEHRESVGRHRHARAYLSLIRKAPSKLRLSSHVCTSEVYALSKASLLAAARMNATTLDGISGRRQRVPRGLVLGDQRIEPDDRVFRVGGQAGTKGRDIAADLPDPQDACLELRHLGKRAQDIIGTEGGALVDISPPCSARCLVARHWQCCSGDR